jgi:DNA polymerase-3 subunit delta'
MSFNEIIGQKKAKEILLGQMKTGKVPHAYLFIGPEGVGRKKTALEFAKALNCAGDKQGGVDSCGECAPCQKISKSLHPDVQIIDFEWQSRLENKEIDKQKALKIDTIRALQKEISLKPVESRWKIFIIEPAEKITLDAANCLLKTLEEPPAWTVIILLAVHKNNLPLTVVSRTQIVSFSPLAENEISGYLAGNLSVPQDAALEVASTAEGSLSFAINNLAGQDPEIKQLWEKISENKIKTADVLEISRLYSKTADEFLDNILICVKKDFRNRPQRFKPAVESIINAKKLLESNCNSQMVLDVMLFELTDNVKYLNS